MPSCLLWQFLPIKIWLIILIIVRTHEYVSSYDNCSIWFLFELFELLSVALKEKSWITLVTRDGHADEVHADYTHIREYPDAVGFGYP